MLILHLDRSFDCNPFTLNCNVGLFGEVPNHPCAKIQKIKDSHRTQRSFGDAFTIKV